MNIVHIVQLYYPVATGSARLFGEISERLAARGHRVTVIATDAYDLEHFWMPDKRRAEPAEEVYHGVRIVRLPVQRVPGPPILYPVLRRGMVELSRLPGSAPALMQLATFTPRLPGLLPLLRSIGPIDVIHATNITLDFAIVPAYRYARQHGIPFFFTPLMHLGEPGSTALARYYSMRHHMAMLRTSDRVLTMTSIERDFLAAQGVPAERIHTVGVGITPADIEGGDGARFRAEHAIAGPMVLTVGAMARDKGTIDVVEAMRRLWLAGSDATLVLIGAPLDHFRTYLETLDTSERARIRVLAYAPEQTKRDALAAASLLALPSRTDSFGIVFLEAWLYGLPVIGARAGGIPAVIDDQRDGLLVPYNDPEALAGALRTLLDDPALAQRLGQQGRAKVLREQTWERVFTRVERVYDELSQLQPTTKERV